jgi:hypothetical protein
LFIAHVFYVHGLNHPTNLLSFLNHICYASTRARLLSQSCTYLRALILLLPKASLSVLVDLVSLIRYSLNFILYAKQLRDFSINRVVCLPSIFFASDFNNFKISPLSALLHLNFFSSIFILKWPQCHIKLATEPNSSGVNTILGVILDPFFTWSGLIGSVVLICNPLTNGSG